MTKLSINEINNFLEQEDNGEALASFDGLDLTGAHSCFNFEIKENIEDILKEIKTLHKKHSPTLLVENHKGQEEWRKGASKAPWRKPSYREDEQGRTIIDLDDPYVNSTATVVVEKDLSKLTIETAWSGFTYEVKQNENGGCDVTFNGPLNGLLQQNLLPTMTYVPYTLCGQFISRETNEALTPFMDINYYMSMRKEKNGPEYNEQDYYGYQINRAFNNEIDDLPQHTTQQERKQQKANANFGRPEIGRHHRNYQKEQIADRLLKKREVPFEDSTQKSDKMEGPRRQVIYNLSYYTSDDRYNCSIVEDYPEDGYVGRLEGTRYLDGGYDYTDWGQSTSVPAHWSNKEAETFIELNESLGFASEQEFDKMRTLDYKEIEKNIHEERLQNILTNKYKFKKDKEKAVLSKIIADRFNNKR